MAGGTHVFDMIKRLKENEALRNKKSYFKNKQAHGGTSKADLIDEKIETEAQRSEIKETLKKERIREKRRLFIIMAVSILLAAILLFYLLNLDWFNQ